MLRGFQLRFKDKIMLRQLTEEAWVLYLKILDIERKPSFSSEHENRIYKLTDQVYSRYIRRRHALELHIIRNTNKQTTDKW
jgi:hypothetical protein